MCAHIPDDSLDSGTLYSRAGFDDVSATQAAAEINLRKENGEMSRKARALILLSLHMSSGMMGRLMPVN